jgi:hypothetical protein
MPVMLAITRRIRIIMPKRTELNSVNTLVTREDEEPRVAG